MLTVLLHALAPGLLQWQVLAHSGQPLPLVLCSVGSSEATGPTLQVARKLQQPFASTPQAPTPLAGLAHQHCPYCLLHPAVALPPPAPLWGGPLPQVSPSWWPRSTQRVHHVFDRLTGHPRGPPIFSL